MAHLEQELRLLKADVLNMMRLTRSQIQKGRQVVLQGDKELIYEVLSNEKRLNMTELGIDRKCESILALYNPVAVDLRFVISMQKINFHLERIGDYVESLSLSLNDLGKAFNVDLLEEMGMASMYDFAMQMMDDAIMALKEEDTERAKLVYDSDRRIDDIHKTTRKTAAEIIRLRPELVDECLILFSDTRKIERIGDLIKNICEEIIFYVDAKVLKHNKGV